MRAKEFVRESGRRLASQGKEVSRVYPEDFKKAKASLDPLLKQAGITAGWTAGGAGSFDPEHPYGGGGRASSGDIDIMIDPDDLQAAFPVDLEQYNQATQALGARAFANVMASPERQEKLAQTASKWALAQYMTKNGYPTDPGTLTVEYGADGKIFSVDLILRPRTAWELHAHDFSQDPEMRGGQLFTDVYPTLVRLASKTTQIDPRTGEEKGSLQYSPDRGLVDRATGQVVAINKNDIAKILLGPKATARDMSSISGIRRALSQDPEKLAQVFPDSTN